MQLTEETIEIKGKGFFQVTFEAEKCDPMVETPGMSYGIYCVAREGRVLDLNKCEGLVGEIAEALEERRIALLEEEKYLP